MFYLSNPFTDPNDPWYYVLGAIFLLLIFGSLALYIFLSNTKKKDGQAATEQQNSEKEESAAEQSEQTEKQEESEAPQEESSEQKEAQEQEESNE